MYFSNIFSKISARLLTINCNFLLGCIFMLSKVDSGAVFYRSDVIWNSVPVELRNCSAFLLYEQVEIDETTEELLNFFEFQDRLLLSFSDQNITNSFHNILDVRRLRSSSCIVALVQVSSAAESPNTTEILYELLKSLDGVIKKDEDYFIFHSPQGENIDALFTSGLVASGVKNKLGIKFSNNSTAISYYTTCFYCDSGKPSLHLISIPNHNSDGFHLSGFTSNILFPDLLKNFHGKEFTVSSPTLARWLNEIREVSPGHWQNRRGVMNSALEHVMCKYNFTGKYFPSAGGGGTGSRHANGTWIGTVGDVLSGRAEIGQTTGQVFSRNKVVGFSFPIVYEWLTFTTGEPQPHYSWKSVYWPLTPLSWLLVIASFAIAFLALTYLLKITDQRVSCKTTAIYLVRTFLEQDARGLELHTKSHTTRMFLAYWLIFSLLITTAYRSKLVSFLAFPMVEEPPKTFKSLAYSAKFEIALQYLHGAAYALLKSSPNPTFQAIYRKMGLEENEVRCFQRAIGAHFGCISWDSVANFVYHKNLSDKFGRVPLIKAPDTCTFIAVGLIFHKRSVFRLKFDEVISRAASVGLTGKWKQLDYEYIGNERKKWERATNRSQVVYEYHTSDVLTVQQLSGTFFLLVAGLFPAILIFFLETIHMKLQRMKNPKHHHHHHHHIGEF